MALLFRVRAVSASHITIANTLGPSNGPLLVINKDQWVMRTELRRPIEDLAPEFF